MGSSIHNNSRESNKVFYLITRLNERVVNSLCVNCSKAFPIGKFRLTYFENVDEEKCEYERQIQLIELCQDCYNELKKGERLPKFLMPLYCFHNNENLIEHIQELEKYRFNLISELFALAQQKSVLNENDTIEKLKKLTASEKANLILDLLVNELFGFNIFGKIVHIQGDEEFYFLRNNRLIEANDLIKKLLIELFQEIITTNVEREFFLKLLGIAEFIGKKEYHSKVNPIRYIKFKNAILDTVNFELVNDLNAYFTYEIPWSIDVDFFEKLRKGSVDEKDFENCLFYRLKRFYDDENWNKLVLALGSIICYGLNERRRFFLIIGEKNTGKSSLKTLIERALGDFTHNMSWNELDIRNRFSFGFLAYGKRIALLSEKPDITVTNIERLKNVLGDDIIPIEQKFKNPIEVETRLRIIAFCNAIPIFKEIDDALLDRIMVIFTQSPLESNEIDVNFVNELIKRENIEDFLKFLLYCGYIYWQRGKVLEEDNEKLKELLIESKDFTIEFIKKCCEEGKGFKERREDLYNAFILFRKENELPLNIDRREFYAKMRTKFEEVKIKGVYYFKGIRIKEEYREQNTLT